MKYKEGETETQLGNMNELSTSRHYTLQYSLCAIGSDFQQQNHNKKGLHFHAHVVLHLNQNLSLFTHNT